MTTVQLLGALAILWAATALLMAYASGDAPRRWFK